MKTKTALGLIAAALVASACTSTPRWDTAVFPNQVHYGEAATVTTVAEAK